MNSLMLGVFFLLLIESIGLSAFAGFNEMSQSEKELALKNYSSWQTFTPEMKQKLEKNWESFQKLAPEQKVSFVERNEKLKGLSPQRKAWLQKRVAAREHRLTHRRHKHQSRSKTRRNTA